MTQSEAEQRIIDGRAWADFCRALERAGDAVLRPTTPATSLDRAEGWRYLTRLLRAALESQIEHGNPSFPGLYQLSNETVKIGNDNPDNFYQNCTISGRHEYRITRHARHGPLSEPGHQGRRLRQRRHAATDRTARGQRAEARARTAALEIRLSCKPQPGNWLPMQPDTSHADRAPDLPRPRARGARAPARSSAWTPRARRRSTPCGSRSRCSARPRFVRGTANKFVDWMNRYSAHLNQLPSDDQEECQRCGRRLEDPLPAELLEARARRGAAGRGAQDPALPVVEPAALATTGWSRSTTATTAST